MRVPKSVKRAVGIGYVAWIALLGGVAQASYQLDWGTALRPAKGIPALVEVSGLRTQPAPVLAAPVRAQGVSRPATVHVASSPWACIAKYESGSNPTEHSGYYEGMYQFAPSTWRSAGGTRYAPHAYQASAEEQTIIAKEWLAVTGWYQWPATSRRCGLR